MIIDNSAILTVMNLNLVHSINTKNHIYYNQMLDESLDKINFVMYNFIAIKQQFKVVILPRSFF